MKDKVLIIPKLLFTKYILQISLQWRSLAYATGINIININGNGTTEITIICKEKRLHRFCEISAKDALIQI